jgi:hypothetical protein
MVFLDPRYRSIYEFLQTHGTFIWRVKREVMCVENFLEWFALMQVWVYYLSSGLDATV